MQQEEQKQNISKMGKTRPVTSTSAFGGNKVAPGMEISFIVRFSPEAKIDYFYELIVVTEREKFVVPIIAVGKRAVLDFPDLVDFENCPVKYCSEKPVIIRNLGDKTCKWQLKLEPPFDADLKEGVLEQHRNEQILLKFNPTEAKFYRTEVSLLYENLQAYVILQGKSHNGNVYLSKSHISMDDAYIGLQTQQTLQIINKSNVKVEFQWRAFKTEKEEQEKKNRLRQQLEQEEAEEKTLVKDIVSNEIIKEEYDIDLEEESDEEEKDEKAIMLKKQKKAELMLSRKYKTIMKAIDDDMLLFQDDIFTIEPSIGQIWPNSEITITIAFFPKAALNYQCTAFCNVSCSDTRLPLHITGEGVGPKATVYPNYYNIGDIFIKDERKCDFMIENQGEIEAKFQLMANDSRFSEMFQFGIESGVLGVGERIPFQVAFCSSILGSFNERFMWKLDGSSELHHIDFTGHVISPSFKFDRNLIDFGKVSFSFPNKQKLKLTNTSTVPFKFVLRIGADIKQNKKEFDIKPNRDLIPPNETISIEITFISMYPKKYDTALVIDIEGVGQDMCSIPITAESEVPTVRIEPPEFLVFEDVFLRNPSIQTIQIINESNLQARFNILPQIEETKILADYYVDQESGEIERNGRAQIQVTLITKKLKEISLKLEINIEGNTISNPYTLILQANSKGPQVRVSEREINFGQIPVLEDQTRRLWVINEGKIEADFYAFTQNKNSIFKPLTKEAILKPQESKEVEIICNADDTIRFHDILYFVIKEGVDIEVNLSAIGVKTTIYCKDFGRNSNIDLSFGEQYTHRTITKEIFVENKGRRSQMLTWVQKKPSKKELQQKEEEQKKQKKTQQQLLEEEHVTFWVIPEKKEIPPKYGYMFQIKAHGIKSGNLIENFSLNSQIGNDRKSNPIYPDIQISCQFISPSLHFSERKLYFKYSWEKNVAMMPLSKQLSITCSSKLPTNFILKAFQPFQISSENFQLQPGQSSTVRVDFDPGLKTDRVSDKLLGKLQVHHLEHPDKDHVDLVGEVCFPNLELEKRMLNFGSILNETSKKQVIWIKNVSEMPLNYQWTFQEELPFESLETSKLDDMKNPNSQPPINEIFDILPLSGYLQPNETQNIEFIFNALGQQQRRYKTTALCKVEGGPDYEVTLIGDASQISYKISTYDIFLGDEIRFCDPVYKEFFVKNTDERGVTFDFVVNLSTIKRKGLVDVQPMSGKIAGGEPQQFKIRISPGWPDEIKETFSIQIAYFEPEFINLRGHAYYPSVVTTLLRQETQDYLEKYEIERKKRNDEQRRLLHIFQQQKQIFKEEPEKMKLQAVQMKMLEQILLEIDTAVDRKIFCQMIQKNLQDYSANITLPQQQNLEVSGISTINKIDTKFFDKIILATFVCDFGNIVINQTKKKTFKVTNSSNKPLELTFDQRQTKPADFAIQPERIKLLPHDSHEVTVIFQPKKSTRFGFNKAIAVCDIKYGAKYNIELSGNITIPEISIPNDHIEFDRVLVGQRKTMYIRITNEKEVVCDWTLQARFEVGQAQNLDNTRFVITPSSGQLQPKCKQMLTMTFTPLAEKSYQTKFILHVRDNPKQIAVICRGTGLSIPLEVTPLNISIGPVLPYEGNAWKIVEVKNLSDYDTEVFSLEFDKEYIKDENEIREYLQRIDQQNQPQQQDKPQSIMQQQQQQLLQQTQVLPQQIVSVRKPGDSFWEEVLNANEKQREIVRLQQDLETVEDDVLKEQMQRRLDELTSESKIVQYPKPVEKDVIHHTVIWGPPLSGKTTMAKQLAKQQNRALVNFNELLEWGIIHQTPASQKAQEFLEQRQKEYDIQLADRQKIVKKAGKKKEHIVDAQLPKIDLNLYQYLPEDILGELLTERLEHPECAAGAIIDNLRSKNCQDELMSMKAILRGCKNCKLQFALLSEQVDEDGLPICQFIEWDNMENSFKEHHRQSPKKQGQGQGQQQQQRTGSAQQQQRPSSKQQKKVGKKEEVKSHDIKGQQDKQLMLKYRMGHDEHELFDVFYPGRFKDESEREKYEKLREEIINLFEKKIEEIDLERLKLFQPPDYILQRELEKKKPVKKKKGQEEIIEEKPDPQIFYNEMRSQLYTDLGTTQLTIVPLYYNLHQFLSSCSNYVQGPIYPDPDLLPVPEAEFKQILNWSNLRERSNCFSEDLTKFSIYGLSEEWLKFKEDYEEKCRRILEKEQQELEDEVKQWENQEKEELLKEAKELLMLEEGEEEPINITIEEEKLEELAAKVNGKLDDIRLRINERETQLIQTYGLIQGNEYEQGRTRWFLPANKTLLLMVRFFTKSIGNFSTQLKFDCEFGQKTQEIVVEGISEFPQISQLPKNIFWGLPKKSRPTTIPESYLSKCWINSEKLFEFGPLLIGKNPSRKDEAIIKNINSSTFRITNQGRFDCQIEVALMSESLQVQNNPQQFADYKRDVFFVEPQKLSISCSGNETTQLVRVWALPQEVGKWVDQLIIMIKDNPTPLILPIQCEAEKPIVEIKEGKSLFFERLLLNQQAKKNIVIKNICAIPVKWKLVGVDELPVEFNVVNIFGELKPTQETVIEIHFKGMKQMKFNQKLVLEVEDVENLGIKQEQQIIQIDAEAFDITVEFKFPNPTNENLLNFDIMRVGEVKTQQFGIRNIGLYKVKYTFNMKKKLFRDTFTIIPNEDELESGQEKMVSIRMKSLVELKLFTNNSTTDINMEILEGKTLELFKPVPINVNANIVYSKYSMNPAKSINFGPIQFNESKSRQFEIKNEGIFDFNYWIFDYMNEESRKEVSDAYQAYLDELGVVIESKDDKKGGKKGKAQKEQKKEPKASKKETKGNKKEGKQRGKGGYIDPSLEVEQWRINPWYGNIPPGQSSIIEIKFEGKSQKLYENKLGIDIQGRDFNDQPDGIMYEVAGESCVPGINTEDFESIFEEQVVVGSLNTGSNITSMINSNVFAIEEKTFFFGTLVPSKVPDGIIEKFKIINQNKIPCNVKFDVRKKSEKATEIFAFEVQPKTAKIAPHEHCYVKVAFKPTIMAQYAAMFEAIVENGEQLPKTHRLVFDLRGEGALPTLKLEKPNTWFDDKTILLKFPRTRLDKTVTLPILLKNEGQVPATVKFDLTPNDSFKFISQTSYTLTPKTYQSFSIEFRPSEAGMKSWNIQMQTLLNPYEITNIKITGEGYSEDVTFEGLPSELDDEINLGDCIVNQEKKHSFYIKNNSGKQLKFQWSSQGNNEFKLLPRVGHLDVEASRLINLSFLPGKTVIHKDFQLILDIKQIEQEQKNQEFNDWDDTKKQIRYVTQSQYDWHIKKQHEEELRRQEEEMLAAEQLKRQKTKKLDKKQTKKLEEIKDTMPKPLPGESAEIPLEEQIPEPEFKEIDKSQKQIVLKANAIADYARYEIDSTDIIFKPTLMFTSRVHRFKVKNTSLINLNFKSKIVSASTAQFDPGFFIISPKNGTIVPNGYEEFILTFSPTEVESSNLRLLVISIENLDPQQKPLILEIDGDTERPICHFEIPPSNYREKKGSIEAKYDIIEFQSLGTKVKNTKRFYVANPTNQGYEFEWKRVDDDKLPSEANSKFQGFFKCNTTKGVILSGKKFEMSFEYSPEIDGTHESYWTFEIPQFNILQYFLIVGTVQSPSIFIDVGKVNFGPLLLTGRNKEIVHIKNLEDVPIPFQFLKESIKGEIDYADSLSVIPMSGVIKPSSDQPIEITFAPKIERSFNYNIQCQVKRKNRPLTLNVKGIGYILHHTVVQDESTVVLNHNEIAFINFGDIFINEKKYRRIIIENLGDFNFDYTIKKSQHINFITITPESGTVRKKEKLKIEILFSPIDEYKFSQKQSRIYLSIISGPTYQFDLIGSARKPAVELSFNNYDFGPCFVLKQPLVQTATLEMKNRDNTAMSIETLFEKKNYLDFKLASGQVLLPLQIDKDKKEQNILKVPILFTPRETKFYKETIKLDINNLHKIDITIQGEGIPFKLELEKTEDALIDFGILRVGGDTTKVVTLINSSKRAINLSFDCKHQIEELKKCCISCIPNKDFSIGPRERQQIEIRFNPKGRLHQFSKEIYFKILENQEQRKLLNVTGACHGIELKMLEDTLGFGPVVINSKLTKTLQVTNLGDIPARFIWETEFCQHFFTIQPRSGAIPAHENILFNITFHPDVVNNDISFTKVKCNVEGAEPLFLNLFGKCVPQPKEQIQEIKFETIVRTQTKQKVILKNSTSKLWRIKAQITSALETHKDFFFGNDILDIPANGQTEYEIFYQPLTMTKNDQVPEIKDERHEGSLFFPLPDGQALLYHLTGKSNPPAPAGTEDVIFKAKTTQIKILNIKNWLHNTQRFQVSWVLDLPDSSIFINGANTIDISGEGMKAYKLAILGLKATTAKASVYFRNVNTNEFVFFRLNITVQPPDIQGKIELAAIVRETTSKIITIENPLTTPVEIKKEFFQVDNDNISFNPNEFTIQANSEFGFEVVYRPLLATELTSKMILRSPELGEYSYILALIGLPQTVQRSLTFKTTLGNDLTQTFKFTNYVKKLTTYQCRLEKLSPSQTKPQQFEDKALSKAPQKEKEKQQQLDFLLENQQINAQPAQTFEGNDITLNIRFEPSNLLESRAYLTVFSTDGGEFNCLLLGYCSPPQPKGPFKISAKGFSIEFKNPFFESQEFMVRVDNPVFNLSAKSPMKIDGKKTVNLAISYKALPNCTSNGRMMIQTGEYPPWVFYLQGDEDELLNKQLKK